MFHVLMTSDDLSTNNEHAELKKENAQLDRELAKKTLPIAQLRNQINKSRKII